MKVRDHIDVYNADLGYGTRDDFQNRYAQSLLYVERAFDEFIAGREITGTRLHGGVYRVVKMGSFVIAESEGPVVAQPVKEVLNLRTNRVRRGIELYMGRIIDGELSYGPYNKWRQDKRCLVGEAALDSSRRRAIPDSLGKLSEFCELFGEVMEEASKEKNGED